MNRFPITKTGYEKLENEIKHLKIVERPIILDAIKIAREYGDLSENAEYSSAKERQSFIEGKIADLEDKMNRAEIIEVEKIESDIIKFGATVKLVDCDTDDEFEYVIVGDYEADMSKRLVSVSAPISKSLMGKTVGQEVSFSTPKGVKNYEILDIKYKSFEM